VTDHGTSTETLRVELRQEAKSVCSREDVLGAGQAMCASRRSPAPRGAEADRANAALEQARDQAQPPLRRRR